MEAIISKFVALVFLMREISIPRIIILSPTPEFQKKIKGKKVL